MSDHRPEAGDHIQSPPPHPTAALDAVRRHVDDAAPAVSVVVPAYNEAANLPTLVAEITAALEPVTSFEVIVVDDGSSDDSPAVARALAAGEPRLRCLVHKRNSGQSAALWTGVVAARGEVIATLDGDGQNDPASIPPMLARFRELDAAAEDVIVCGIRTKRRDSASKRWASRIANGVRRRWLDDEVTDTGCGLKVFSRGGFLALPAFNHMHRFLPALYKAAGARIDAMPVNHRPRMAGESKYGLGGRLWVGLFDLVGVKWLMRRRLHPGASLSPGRLPYTEID